MAIVLDRPDQIRFAQLLARKGALKLEILGFKRRGRSAYSICKSEYGLKGTREEVLRQLCQLIDRELDKVDR